MVKPALPNTAFTTPPVKTPEPAPSIFAPTSIKTPVASTFGEQKDQIETKQPLVTQPTLPNKPETPKEPPASLPPVEIAPTAKDPSNPFLLASASQPEAPVFKYTFSAASDPPAPAQA